MSLKLFTFFISALKYISTFGLNPQALNHTYTYSFYHFLNKIKNPNQTGWISKSWAPGQEPMQDPPPHPATHEPMQRPLTIPPHHPTHAKYSAYIIMLHICYEYWSSPGAMRKAVLSTASFLLFTSQTHPPNHQSL